MKPILVGLLLFATPMARATSDIQGEGHYQIIREQGGESGTCDRIEISTEGTRILRCQNGNLSFVSDWKGQVPFHFERRGPDGERKVIDVSTDGRGTTTLVVRDEEEEYAADFVFHFR